MRDILSVIQELLCQSCGLSPDAITPHTDLRPLSCRELANLAMGCEKVFRITLQDEWVADFTCVADVILCIERELSDGQNTYAPPSDEKRDAWYYP
ncbi:MAG: hypothetical protein E7329_01500 [Clostridiales bacterium]|nr:hypothetical protein [Clostridiales bacterium]